MRSTCLCHSDFVIHMHSIREQPGAHRDTLVEGNKHSNIPNKVLTDQIRRKNALTMPSVWSHNFCLVTFQMLLEDTFQHRVVLSRIQCTLAQVDSRKAMVTVSTMFGFRCSSVRIQSYMFPRLRHYTLVGQHYASEHKRMNRLQERC